MTEKDESWRGKIGKLEKEELDEFLTQGIVSRVATLDANGWPYVVPAWFEWLMFSIGSVVMLLFFRKRLIQLWQPGASDIDSLVGETALPLETIRPGAIGRAELRGTVWSARNAHDGELARGQRARVQRVDGLTLYLVPER